MAELPAKIMINGEPVVTGPQPVMIDTLTDVVLKRNGRLECPACHEAAMTHQHLKGYGQVISVVFKCWQCGRKSELAMVRADRATMVGWRSVDWHPSRH
jgi:hypothetical protein